MTPIKSEYELNDWCKYLDKLSELNKLRGRGSGDLEDNCYICGISPSGHKDYVLKMLNDLKRQNERELVEAKLETLEYLLTSDPRYTHEALKDIIFDEREALEKLTNQEGEK